MRIVAMAVVALAAAGVLACRNVGIAENYQWTLKAPKTVRRGQSLTFTVEVTDLAGAPAKKVTYLWVLDWVSGKLSSTQKGRSNVEESAKIKSDAAPGPATLKIFAQDKEGKGIQVAETIVQIE